jgi:hypothetical protein
VSSGIKPKIFEYIDDVKVSELILTCIGPKINRPAVNEFKEHPFFNDKISKKNNLPVALTDEGKQHKDKTKNNKDKKNKKEKDDKNKVNNKFSDEDIKNRDIKNDFKDNRNDNEVSKENDHKKELTCDINTAI